MKMIVRYRRQNVYITLQALTTPTNGSKEACCTFTQHTKNDVFKYDHCPVDQRRTKEIQGRMREEHDILISRVANKRQTICARVGIFIVAYILHIPTLALQKDFKVEKWL